MTYREKLQLEYPERVSKYAIGGCMGCPSAYWDNAGNGICLPDDYVVNTKDCTECWDREVLQTDTLTDYQLLKSLYVCNHTNNCSACEMESKFLGGFDNCMDALKQLIKQRVERGE